MNTYISIKAVFITACCILAISILASCSFNSGYTQYRVTPLKGNTPFQTRGKIYFTMPKDYGTNQGRVENSGEETRQALQKGLAKRSEENMFASAPQSHEQSLEAARAAGCRYVVSSEILEWVDTPAFFGGLDRGEVMLQVYSSASGELLRMDNVSCSGSATLVYHIGTHSPADCLVPAFTRWEKELFTEK